MKATLLGAAEVSFKDSSGKLIEGMTGYFAFDDPNVRGQKTERFFINADIPFPSDVSIGDDVELTFTYRGKLESVTKA